MRGIWAAAVALAVGSVVTATGWPTAALAKSSEEFTLGQWAGYSYISDSSGQFTDCTAWASADNGVQLGVSVLKDWSLELWLYSKPWNLPNDQSYPVSFWVDRNAQYHGKAFTNSAQYVYVKVDRAQDAYAELQNGSQLTFRTSSEDYVFDLSGSRAALNRLIDCVDQYSKSATTNPFGGDTGAQQQGTGQQGNNQQGADQQGNQGGGSGGGMLQNLTVSAEDVHTFLTEVTGAKPSMITVTAKSDKAGTAYYLLETPLGGGQFWQQDLGGGQLQSVADAYLQSYKGDCKGAYEQNPSDPVQGQDAQMVAGTAYCASSPYQDDGPEVLSYTMTESKGVISEYITYIGGNSAKAKTDALGKLIAGRSRDLMQPQ